MNLWNLILIWKKHNKAWCHLQRNDSDYVFCSDDFRRWVDRFLLLADWFYVCFWVAWIVYFLLHLKPSHVDELHSCACSQKLSKKVVERNVETILWNTFQRTTISCNNFEKFVTGSPHCLPTNTWNTEKMSEIIKTPVWLIPISRASVWDVGRKI